MTAIARDEMDAWRADHPVAALNECVSVALGLIITHEVDAAKREAAANVLIACHKAALAAFSPERRQRLN
jgi:hypothetical protein